MEDAFKSFDLVHLFQKKHTARLSYPMLSIPLLVRKSSSPRDSPANSGHLGGATKTLDSMTAALRSKLPNPTTLSTPTDHLTSEMQCHDICFFHGAFYAKKTLGT
jgi:hypothetical protein